MHDPQHSANTAPPAYRDARPRTGMGRAARVLLILFGAAAVCVFVTLSAIAYAAHAVMTSPAVRVQVDEKHGHGPDVDVVVPANLIAAGMTLAPWVLPDDTLDQVRRDVDAGLAEIPVDGRRLAADLMRDLRNMPDARLVEVVDGHDHVVVFKRGGDLLVQVKSPGADVDVTVPLTLVDRALAFIDS